MAKKRCEEACVLATRYEEENIRINQELEVAQRRIAELEADNFKLKSQLTEAQKESLTDSLTKVMNRKGLDRSLEFVHANAVRARVKFSLLMFDVDFFKRINDGYGHGVGDLVLKQIATVTNLTIRTSDIFARFGGEEFCVIMPSTTAEVALILAERIRIAVSKDVKAKSVTISIGVVEWKGQEIKELLKLADEAMYQAKQTGRNRVVVGE